jgi:outer membrane receptor protein involved in Fe transport
VPERTSTLSTTLRHRFWEKGSIEAALSYQTVSDFQDLVPVNVSDAAGNVIARFNGPGNIGKGKRWNVEIEGTLPLDRFTKSIGLTGMELKFLAHHHGSRVTDPVTGLSRRQSGTPQFHYSASLRHDLERQKITWGLSTYFGQDSTSYFINQISRNSNNLNLDFFLEYRGLKNGTLRLDINNLSDVELARERTFFIDTRTSNSISQRFVRDQRRDQLFKLSYSRTF